MPLHQQSDINTLLSKKKSLQKYNQRENFVLYIEIELNIHMAWKCMQRAKTVI